MIARTFAALAAFLPAAFAAQAASFAPPQPAPTATSTNYTGAANNTLPKSPLVPGKAFDRFIQIWLENTDFNDAATTSAFMDLKKQGILLSQYYALTHPSEPNYAASVGGDFWAMGDDDFYQIPSNISTIVDLLEAKNISWASYQESMPTDGFQGYSWASPNYLNTSAAPYTYYMRKHNPTILYNSVANVPSRAALHRNFNDFANDVDNDSLPQWTFFTPNMINDGHDTSVQFASDWLNFWLVPLLSNPKFNNNRTLVLLTFDENESYTINNRVYTLLLGGVIPPSLWNSEDSTYYTHYSALSTVQANWQLGSLGRQDTNKTVSNVFSLVANATGYQNLNITADQMPLTNLTGVFAGPLNAELYVPFLAPNPQAVGAGGGPVFIADGVDMNLNAATAPAPQNLTALGEVVPSEVTSSAAAPSPSTTSNTTNTAGDSGGSGSSGAIGLVAASKAVAIAVAGACVVFML